MWKVRHKVDIPKMGGKRRRRETFSRQTGIDTHTHAHGVHADAICSQSRYSAVCSELLLLLLPPDMPERNQMSPNKRGASCFYDTGTSELFISSSTHVKPQHHLPSGTEEGAVWEGKRKINELMPHSFDRGKLHRRFVQLIRQRAGLVDWASCIKETDMASSQLLFDEVKLSLLCRTWLTRNKKKHIYF